MNKINKNSTSYLEPTKIVNLCFLLRCQLPDKKKLKVIYDLISLMANKRYNLLCLVCFISAQTTSTIDIVYVLLTIFMSLMVVILRTNRFILTIAGPSVDMVRIQTKFLFYNNTFLYGIEFL